jgi:tetratricopeptide (TPR) repeat protein
MSVKRHRAKESKAGGPARQRTSLGDDNRLQLQNGESGTFSLRDAAGFASILCATLAAYLPALQGGLLWDDSSHVTRPDLRFLHGLWRIWFHLGATQQYYPLLHSAFWMEHRIWGDAVLGYHLTNIALHAASACLVVMIVRRLALPGAWLAGLVFALHPACVEAVAWISEQKSTLSGVFYLASALAYLRFDQSRRGSRYWLALALFVLALLTKTVTATLPAALLVIFWWQRGRIEWKRDLQPLLPWFALGASAGLFTAWIERTLIGAQGADFKLTLVQRCLLAGRVICFYAGKLLWPSDLTFIYPRWNIDPGEWWQYLFPAAVVALAIGFCLAARRHRGPLAGFLIFAGTLFPILGFLNVYPFRYAYVADHFLYLACLGIIVPVASALAVAARRISPASVGRVALPAVLLAVLGALTWRQSGIYRDSETLYRETLRRNPASWLAHNNLGNSLLEIPGRRGEAIAQFEAALRIKPDYSEAHLSLGNALMQIPGRLADAVAEYQTAVRLDPGSERAHSNLGQALLQAGRPQEAIAQLETALQISPGYAEAHNNLGNALSRMPGRLQDAVAQYETAIRLDPDLPEAHNNLGRALAQMPGGMPGAIAQFEAAIRLRPDYAGAHNNLGNALSQMPGRLRDAIAEYRAALRIDPDFVQAHLNLGNALLQIPGSRADAIAEYEAAMRIQPSPELQRLLERLRAGQK